MLRVTELVTVSELVWPIVLVAEPVPVLVAEVVMLLLAVKLPVADSVGVPVAFALRDTDLVGVFDGVTVPDAVIEADAVMLLVAIRDTVLLAPNDMETNDASTASSSRRCLGPLHC